MDEMQQLLALMGVASFAEGVAVLTTVNSTLESAQAVLSTKGTAATLSALMGRHARLAALEKAAGKEGDEADGLFRAALVSHAELPKAHAELAQLKKDGQTLELDKAIDKAKAASKLTPALESDIRKQFADGSLTLATAQWMLDKLQPVAALAAAKDGAQPAPASAPVIVELTWSGKKWAELSGPERVQLLQENKDLYTAMRDVSRG